MSLLPKPPRNLLDEVPLDQPIRVGLYSNADPLEPMDTEGPAVIGLPDLLVGGLVAFEQVVAHLTYKPGYILRVMRPPMLRVVAELDDTYHPGRRLEVAMHFPLPEWLLERWGSRAGFDPALAEEEMVRWVRKALGWHELHERDEWLKVEGARPFDPHQGPNGPDPTRLGVRP